MQVIEFSGPAIDDMIDMFRLNGFHRVRRRRRQPVRCRRSLLGYWNCMLPSGTSFLRGTARLGVLSNVRSRSVDVCVFCCFWCV